MFTEILHEITDAVDPCFYIIPVVKDDLCLLTVLLVECFYDIAALYILGKGVL